MPVALAFAPLQTVAFLNRVCAPCIYTKNHSMELIVLSFIRLSLACSRRSHSIGLTARRGRPRPATSRRPAPSLSSGAISRRACPRATPNRWQSTPLQSGKAAQVSCRYVTAWPQPHAPARRVHEAGAASLSIWDRSEEHTSELQSR